jgi:hypothetical protein
MARYVLMIVPCNGHPLFMAKFQNPVPGNSNAFRLNRSPMRRHAAAAASGVTDISWNDPALPALDIYLDATAMSRGDHHGLACHVERQ